MDRLCAHVCGPPVPHLAPAPSVRSTVRVRAHTSTTLQCPPYATRSWDGSTAHTWLPYLHGGVVAGAPMCTVGSRGYVGHGALASTGWWPSGHGREMYTLTGRRSCRACSELSLFCVG